MSYTEKLLQTIILPSNVHRLISEIALNDLINHNLVHLFQDLKYIISKTNQTSLKEMSYMLVRFLIVNKKLLDFLSNSDKLELTSLCMSDIIKIFVPLPASLCLSCIIINDIIHDDYLLLEKLIKLHNPDELNPRITIIRTLGYICEDVSYLKSDWIEIIYAEITKRLYRKETKIIALQTIRRSLRIFKTAIDSCALGKLLYCSCIDESIEIRIECLETIIEYSLEYMPEYSFIDIEILLSILCNDAIACKLLVLEIFCALKITYDIRLINLVINAISDPELHESCVLYLSHALEYKEIMNYAQSFITFNRDTLYTSLSICGCIPSNSAVISEYLGYIVDSLTYPSLAIREISAWALSQIVSPGIFKDKSNSVIQIILDLLFSSMDCDNEHIKIYCC